MYKQKKNDGWITAEIIVAMVILGLLLTGLATTMYACGRFNKIQLIKQQCMAAALGQLDSITATGKPINDADFKRLWSGVEVVIEEHPGTGNWQGLKMVKVTTIGKNRPRQITVELCRYVTIEEPR